MAPKKDHFAQPKKHAFSEKQMKLVQVKHFGNYCLIFIFKVFLGETPEFAGDAEINHFESLKKGISELEAPNPDNPNPWMNFKPLNVNIKLAGM